MASRSFFLIALALLFAALAFSAEATRPKPRPIKRKLCFVKKQVCCFRYRPCGFVIGKVKVYRPCPIKKCHRVCPKRCRFIKVKVFKRVCKHIRIPIKKCKKVKVWKNGRLVWAKRCRIVKYVKKTWCVHKPVFKKKKVCRRKRCKKVCKVIHAVCLKIKVFKYLKVCPHVRCRKVKVFGKFFIPRPRVLRKGRLVKIINVHRKW